MRARMAILLLACGTVVAASASAADLRQALSEMEEGRLRFSFETRSGVYGDGHRITAGDDGHSDWDCDCDEGPGRMQLRFRDGRLRAVTFRVGGHWSALREGDVDLGEVPPAEASSVLLDYALDEGEEDLIFAATVAKGFDDWARVLDIARDRHVVDEVREQCVFWLGQQASEVATRGLQEIVDDDDEELQIREQAIFSLSQHQDAGVFKSLRQIALHNRHPQLREQAMFWLGQVDDPRVLDFFEEVLFSGRDGG